MNILYVDLLSYDGHKKFNCKMVDILMTFGKVDTIFKADYLSGFSKKNNINHIYHVPNKYLPESVKKLPAIFYKTVFRYKLFKAMKWIEDLVAKNRYDFVYFGGVEIVSFVLATQKINYKCFFVDHSITHTDTNWLKRFFWKRVPMTVSIVVMEGYIKDYLCDRFELENDIFVVMHPLPMIPDELWGTKRIENRMINNVIAAPSGSNDEAFIRFLIENEDRIGNNKIIIRSKETSYKSKNLEVYKGWLTDKQYVDLMIEAGYILLPYDTQYNYRISGVFYEALLLGKKCLLSSNNTLSLLKQKYPNTIVDFRTYEDFIVAIDENINIDNTKEIEGFIKEHSDESIKKQLLPIINKAKLDH